MSGLTLVLLLMAIISLAVSVLFFMKYARFKKYRVSNIANASPGPVIITGKAVAREGLITSEFSKEGCLYYKFSVVEHIPRTYLKIALAG